MNDTKSVRTVAVLLMLELLVQCVLCVFQGVDGFGYNYQGFYQAQYPYLASSAGGAVTTVPSTQTYQLIDSPVTTSAGTVLPLSSSASSASPVIITMYDHC